MKLKMLPNWCKKVGVSLFVIGGSIPFYTGFTEGMRTYGSDATKYNNMDHLYSDPTVHLFEIISIIGLVIYMFSKEKIEDDYINSLRLESFQTTALLGLAITIILNIVFGNFSLELDYFTNLFLMFYLTIFAIKKRTY